ncbi:hypothetical protein [Micromonospora humida]|uniref:Uncharacterized protein n=1 Tax=Micromonospora humida TaxID=2809018 RepID=A0ABS2IWY5_9ACTN|nr:hypothetical protein [Micromonospora humida]MBM7078847.1 hypothetical protein [Micromonospora humida]
MRRWWRALKPAEQVGWLGLVVTLVTGVIAAVPAYLTVTKETPAVADSAASSTPPPDPTTRPPGTPEPTEPPTPPATPTASTTPSSPPPTRTPPPTVAPTVTRTPLVRFAISVATVVPNCLDISGTGDEPPAGRTAVLFVRPAGASYFYEKPLHFPTPHSCQARRVVVGDQTSPGRRFELHVFLVSNAYARELAKHDGAPYSVPDVPGEPLTSAVVTRTDEIGNC